MNDLVDTTEMYLRTVYELEEEGITPLRARIAERLDQSGPTVSQTVARMERDGLVQVAGDRHLELTQAGRDIAVSVMRKHRLAERLLVDVIGLNWGDAHAEACRWEHVMSDEVERRLVEVLDHPTTSPYGNPIPGLGAVDSTHPDGASESGQRLSDLDVTSLTSVAIRRLAEVIQVNVEFLETLHESGIVPGAHVCAQRTSEGMQITTGSTTVLIDPSLEHAIQVDVLP